MTTLLHDDERRAVIGKRAMQRIRDDFMDGVSSGVNGTPTFFMNGVRYDGAYDLDAMLAALRSAGGTASPGS